MKDLLKSNVLKKAVALLLAVVLGVGIGFPAVASHRGNRLDKSSPVPKVAVKEEKKEGATPAPAPVVVAAKPGTVGALTPNRSYYVKENKKSNKDTVAWFSVPDTGIDSIIMQKSEYKNEFYGNRNFKLETDKNGTFFADYRSTVGEGFRSELTRNTVLYGHSWSDDPNAILFSQMKKYRTPEFAKANPYLFFSTEKEDMAFEIFAVFDAHINFPYNMPQPNLGFTEAQQLEVMKDSSPYVYEGVTVSPEDKILTISTCTLSAPGHPNLPDINDYRFVVAAKLVSPQEMAKKEASFTVRKMVPNPDNFNTVK